MEKYSLSPVQWTNDGVIKPTRKLIEDKIVWVEDVLSFKPDANQYGIATMTHKLGNITYVQWNNKNYLVESCIELNNGLFKYNLESDIWVNLVIPFFEKNESKSFNILREGKQWMDNNSLRFNDPLIDQYDIQYDEWLPYDGETFSYTTAIINRDAMFSNMKGNMLTYTSTPSQPPMRVYGTVCKYFVFTSTFNGFNNAKVMDERILAQQYLVFPVINDWESKGGKVYNNYESELQNLAIVNSTSFIGVFKGPMITQIDNTTKRLSTKTRTFTFNWMEMQYSSSGDKWLLFCETGQRPVSVTTYNNLDRYDKIIIGETELTAQSFNNYSNPKNNSIRISSIFTGSGFNFYPEKWVSGTSTNLLDRKALYGSYGSFLPYIGDDYKSYTTQNASQINTGLISAGVGVATSAVGLIGSVAAIPFSAGASISGTISAGAGLISSATALKDKQDNLSKMRRHNETKPVQSNINDIANYIYFADSPYSWVKKPTRDSQSIINRIASMYGIPVQKTIAGRNLCQAATNEPEPYEIDALSINFWLSATSGFTKLEKTLITISLNGPYVLVNNYGDIKRRMLIVEENELVEEIRQNKILKNLTAQKEEENEKEDI